jgi:ParB family chromosome partitioning protein
MAKKGGLGKGIKTIFQENESERRDSIVVLGIDEISPNRSQPRTEFDPEALQELADSIKEHGIIQPPLVEEAGNGMYYIIAGERRTRAARLAGLTQIPVRVKSFSEENKLEVALIENIQREDLNALEEALAYKKLMDMANITQEEVAKRVGKNRSTVANALRLLKLPEDMQNALADDKITAGHARALLSVGNNSDMRILFGRIMGQGLSVREAENQAQEMNGKPISKPESKKAPNKNNPITEQKDHIRSPPPFMAIKSGKTEIKTIETPYTVRRAKYLAKAIFKGL